MLVEEGPISVEIVGESAGGHLDRASTFILVAPCLYSTVKFNCWENSNQRVGWPPVSFMPFREVRGL